MRKFIDAVKLIAEINEIIVTVKVKNHPDEFGSIEQCMASAEIEALNLTLDCIKELQHEQPEVDENFFFDEILYVFDSNGWLPPKSEESMNVLETIARHFYELGLNAKKEE